MGISTEVVLETTMGVGAALRTLGRFLDECETHQAVVAVDLAETSADDGRLDAEVTLRLSTDDMDAFSDTSTTIEDDGTLTVARRSTTAILPSTPEDVELRPRKTDLAPDGTTTVVLDARVEAGADGGTITGPTDVAASDGEGDESRSVREPRRESRDVPPFRDRELLQEVYDSCDTFGEMPEALGMDVTAETVRRYMIRQGIHEPASYDTSGGDASSDVEAADEEAASDRQSGDDLDSAVVLADGIGLPDDVTVDAIVDVVRRSNTIYEVKRDIGIQRDDALEMLKELDLLEFVAGRLATEAQREVSREQIVERLRETADAT